MEFLMGFHSIFDFLDAIQLMKMYSLKIVYCLLQQFAIRLLPYFTLFFFCKSFLYVNLFYLLNKKYEISYIHCNKKIYSKIDELFH